MRAEEGQLPQTRTRHGETDWGPSVGNEIWWSRGRDLIEAEPKP
jgi:hypothetical protein